MACLVSQPWWPGDVADGKDSRLAGGAPSVGHDMPSVDFDLCSLQPEFLRVAGDADSENCAFSFNSRLTALKGCRDAARTGFQAGQPRPCHNLHAALYKGFLDKIGYFGILDRQDPVHRLDQCHFDTHVEIE